VPPVLREQSGGARRLPGPDRAEPPASGLPACSGCLLDRPGTPRPVLPEPSRVRGHPLWLLPRRRGSPPVAGAAPPPSPALTGESPTRRQACAGDGRRARHECEGAEHPRHAALPSSPRGRGRLKKCVGQPRGGPPGHGKHVRTPDRRLTAPAPGSGKNETNRSQGECGS
jgi:hypothetical protein